MASLVSPLVNPNANEDHFDRIARRRSPFRHPLLLLALAAIVLPGAVVAIIHYHIGF